MLLIIWTFFLLEQMAASTHSFCLRGVLSFGQASQTQCWYQWCWQGILSSYFVMIFFSSCSEKKKKYFIVQHFGAVLFNMLVPFCLMPIFPVNVFYFFQDGLSAIHKAIICNKQAIVNYLLRNSANPFVRDRVSLFRNFESIWSAYFLVC